MPNLPAIQQNLWITVAQQQQQQQHPYSGESHVHTTPRMMHYSGTDTAPQRREDGPRSPADPTARALEDLFNEEQSAEEQRVQQRVEAPRTARLPSSHQPIMRTDEEDLFANVLTGPRSNTATAQQNYGMATENAPHRATPRQRMLHEPLQTPGEADMVVRAVPHTALSPLRVWLPRHVEVLCTPTGMAHPRTTPGVPRDDPVHERIHTTPPQRRPPQLFLAGEDHYTHHAQNDDASGGDGSFQVALWRRRPRIALPRNGRTTSDAEGAPTSLLSSPRWYVAAYEAMSLSLPSVARCTNGSRQGLVLQQTPVSYATVTQLSKTGNRRMQNHSSVHEDEDEGVVADAEDEDEAAAVTNCRDHHHHPPIAIGSMYSCTPPPSASTRVYWSAARSLEGPTPSIWHSGGGTSNVAHDDDCDESAAFAGKKSSPRLARNSAQGGAHEPRAQNIFLSPGQDERGGREGDNSDRHPRRASRGIARSGVHRDEPPGETPLTPTSATFQRLLAARAASGCWPASSIDVHITLPWLLHTCALPPVAADALARCLETHIQAYLPPATATQCCRRNSTCQPRVGGVCASGSAWAHPQHRPPPNATPSPTSPPPSLPPPCWVAAFAHTEGMQRYATNHASFLVHAGESTGEGRALHDCRADPRPVECGPSPAAQIDLIPWPAWVPDASTSVRLLAALTSGAFLLMDTIARALERASMDVAEEENTGARRGGMAMRSGGGNHLRSMDSRESRTTTAAAAAPNVATILNQFHIFCELVFGDATNKSLCRHVRDRLPMHVSDLSELLCRPWCGVTVNKDAGTAATSATAPSVWKARCPSVLDLVHHLARAWMKECFSDLADRLHRFLITHNPGVVLDLTYARVSDGPHAVAHADSFPCVGPLSGVGPTKCSRRAFAAQSPCNCAHQRQHLQGAPVPCPVPGAVAAAMQELPPHALIYRSIAEFTQGPLQRWERWWRSSPSSTLSTYVPTTNGAASAAFMQWATHVNYATVHSLQWALRHPLVPQTSAEDAQLPVSTRTAVTDMLSLLELLTLVPPLLETTALTAYEAEAVLRGACASVMGNAGDGGAGHGTVLTDTPSTPLHASNRGFHAYYRVFIGLVCYGATQLSDAEGVALLSRPCQKKTGVTASTTPNAHYGADSALPGLRSAQTTVDSLWSQHVLPLVVGYVSGSGAGPAPAARMDALTAAHQYILYTRMLLQLLRLEGRSTRHSRRGEKSHPTLQNEAQQDASNVGASPSQYRHKRARSATFVGSGSQSRDIARRAGSCSGDAQHKWWAPPPTNVAEHPFTARSPPTESVSSSAFTADTATTRRWAKSSLASTNEPERVDASVAEVSCPAEPAFGPTSRPPHRDGKISPHNAASDVVVSIPLEEDSAPPPYRIPPLVVLAHGSTDGAATAIPQCHDSPTHPHDWQGACRQLVRQWLQPLPRTQALHPLARSSESSRTQRNVGPHAHSLGESEPEAEVETYQEKDHSSPATKAGVFSEALPKRPPLLGLCGQCGGHALHRRDIRRVSALLEGLAQRVAAVREEEPGAHTENIDAHGTGYCYDYLYGVLPPGLRSRDGGLITVDSTSTSDEDLYDVDIPCRIASSPSTISTSGGSSGGSNSCRTLGTSSTVSASSPSLSTPSP